MTSMRAHTTLALALMAALTATARADAPVQPPDQRYRAARAALARGDADAAKRELQLSLQNHPLHGESHLLLASILGRENQLDQAIVGFQHVTRLEPRSAVARYNLGTALLRRGEANLAARALEEAVVLRPDHAPSYANLGNAYHQVGLSELAIVSYREALRLDPAIGSARQNLALLTVAAAPAAAPTATDDKSAPGAGSAPPAEPAAAKPSPAPPSASDSAAIASMRALVTDMPHVKVEPRGDRLALTGWTRDARERKLLDAVLRVRPEVLDLTSADAGDPHRLLEIDAMLFMVVGLDTEHLGHNFLRNVQVASQYFAGDPSPAVDWLFSASINYQVNIANASAQRIAFLARPHLTALSGSTATFIAGGDIVFKVSGTTSGDIKPYPFGTSLDVTPTLLRTKDEKGGPLVRVNVKAGRRSVLPLESLEAVAADDSVAFSNLSVTSEAVLGLGQTLILTGLSQRESNTTRSGVPVLKDIPVVQLLFSNKATTISDISIIILLTPRDPAFLNEQHKKAVAEFVEKRRAFIRARKGTEEDMRRFKERYPDWDKLAPNRFASHFFLMENSEVYRAATGMELTAEDMDLELLGEPPKTPASPAMRKP